MKAVMMRGNYFLPHILQHASYFFTQ